jgi:PAS domain S-box-containing protein
MSKKNIPAAITTEEELRQSNASLRIINMISDALHLSRDFDTVVKEAAKAMDEFFRAPSVSIFMLNEKEQRLDQVFASDPDIEPARLIRTLPLERGSLTALSVARKEIVICEDTSKDKIMRPDVRAAIIKWGRKTILSLPLLFNDQVLGAMNLFFAERRTFTQSEQEIFLSIGKTIGLALTNARHVSQLEEEIAERKKAENALSESENKYRNIFNNSTEGISQSTPGGKILTCNQALADILGYDSPEDLKACIKNLGTDLFVQPERRQEFLDLMNKDGFVRGFEYKAYRKDHRIIDIMINADTIMDEKHSDLYFQGALRDITELKRYQEHLEELVRERTDELISANKKMQDEIAERRQTQEALELSEEKYRSIFENTMEGIYQSRMDGRYLNVNPAFARMFGYATPDEMIHSVTNIAKQLYKYPEEWEKLTKLMVEQGVIKNYEIERLRKDGQSFWQLLNAHFVRDSKGNILMTEGTCIDITESKRAAEALKKNEEMLHLITDNMSDMIRVTDLQGVNLYASPSHLAGLGYKPEERLGNTGFDIAHPDDLPMLINEFAKGLAGTEPMKRVEYRVKHADGHYIWLDTIVNAIRDDQGQVKTIVMSSRDVTDRKLLEEALAKSEEKYRLITENIMDCIVLADANGIFQYVTYCREILGYDPEEMIGKTGLNFTYPDEKPRIERIYKEGIEKGWHEITYETKLRHKDGHYISMDVRARTLIDPEGKVIGAVIAARDMAQGRQMEEERLFDQKSHFAVSSLSPREKEILTWVMQGKSTWDISTILKISERTVKFHVENVMKKLSAVNRTQAVAIALRDKLI